MHHLRLLEISNVRKYTWTVISIKGLDKHTSLLIQCWKEKVHKVYVLKLVDFDSLMAFLSAMKIHTLHIKPIHKEKNWCNVALLGTQSGLNSGGGGHWQLGMPTGQSHTACNSTIRQTSLELHPRGQIGSGKGGSEKIIPTTIQIIWHIKSMNDNSVIYMVVLHKLFNFNTCHIKTNDRQLYGSTLLVKIMQFNK